MNHYFDSRIAKMYGIKTATFFSALHESLIKNIIAGACAFGDRYWVAFTEETKDDPFSCFEIREIEDIAYNLQKRDEIEFCVESGITFMTFTQREYESGGYPRPNISKDTDKKHESKRKCALCNSTYKLQKHHIVPKRFGGKNRKNNLIDVCTRCHSKVHQEYISVALKEKDESFFNRVFINLKEKSNGKLP